MRRTVVRRPRNAQRQSANSGWVLRLSSECRGFNFVDLLGSASHSHPLRRGPLTRQKGTARTRCEHPVRAPPWRYRTKILPINVRAFLPPYAASACRPCASAGHGALAKAPYLLAVPGKSIDPWYVGRWTACRGRGAPVGYRGLPWTSMQGGLCRTPPGLSPPCNDLQASSRNPVPGLWPLGGLPARAPRVA